MGMNMDSDDNGSKDPFLISWTFFAATLTMRCQDMEKGADAQTLSAEIFGNRGIFGILEEYSPSYSKETFHIGEIFN